MWVDSMMNIENVKLAEFGLLNLGKQIKYTFKKAECVPCIWPNDSWDQLQAPCDL